MIQAIGLMIAAYIWTRMIETLGNKDANLSTKIFATLTLLIVALGAITLFSANSSGLH